jgi:S-formylglutathione hydrolase FrmB
MLSLRSLIAAAFAALLAIPASRAAVVDRLPIPSAQMHKEIPAVIVVPESYAKSAEALPVVYLLHGYSGNQEGWIKMCPLGEFADRYNIIIVSLDGAFDSWYFDIPSDPDFQYETYVSKEAVAFMDKNYRTIASPKGRAIAGLSMGGHGAMYLSLRHKDVFGAAGSMSGGLDIRPFPKNWGISKHIGTIEEHPGEWETHTVINNLKELKNGELALIFDCGVKDFFLQVNRNFHEALLKQGIDHDYTERPGGHTAEYWKNALPYQLLFFHNFFLKAAQPAPAQTAAK